MVKAYPRLVVKVTKSIKIYQYFRYLKFASSASQNAGKCVSKSLEIQNFLGGACPQTPLESKGPPGLATLTQINATPTSKTVQNPAVNVFRVNELTEICIGCYLSSTRLRRCSVRCVQAYNAAPNSWRSHCLK